MFDLNFISEPGVQNETSDSNWSFLNNINEPDKNRESDSSQSRTSFIQKNSWKNYAFVLTILGFIAGISLVNTRYTQAKPELVLNQVIDIIDKSSYIKNLQLEEAIFSTDQIKITIRSNDFAVIHSFSEGFRMENEIPYAMYQKGEYSYLNLIFPWAVNEKGGDITILQSLVDNTLFSNKFSISHTENIFEIQGRSSDIISFLLQMAENMQIQEFNFSVFHQDSGQFNLIVQN